MEFMTNTDFSLLVLSRCDDYRAVLLLGAVNKNWQRFSKKSRDQIKRSLEMIRWMKRVQMAGYYGQSVTCDARLTVYQTPLKFAWFVEIDRHIGRWSGFVMMDPLKGAVFITSQLANSELDGPSSADVQKFKDSCDFLRHLDQLRGQIAVFAFP